MKKNLLGFAVCLSALSASAQNYEKIKTIVLLNQYKTAKEELDKSMADAKFTSKPEAYILKSTIYAGLAVDDKNKGTQNGDQLTNDAIREKNIAWTSRHQCAHISRYYC